MKKKDALVVSKFPVLNAGQETRAKQFALPPVKMGTVASWVGTTQAKVQKSGPYVAAERVT